VLSFNVAANCWRNAVHTLGITASCQVKVEQTKHTFIHKHILSTAFQNTPLLQQNNNSISPIITSNNFYNY
jgi:hypothetical protein